MTLQNILIAKLNASNLVGILTQLGYKKTSVKNLARLTNLLTDEDLGLSKSYFDFKYSNREFLQSLCEILDIEYSDHSEEVENIALRILNRSHAFKSFIYIDTGFIRGSQPIISLALMESKRNITIPIEICEQSTEQQINFVKTFVINHYIDHEGTLPLWGDIKHYVFYYAKDAHSTFNCHGETVNPIEIIVNRATICI